MKTLGFLAILILLIVSLIVWLNPFTHMLDHIIASTVWADWFAGFAVVAICCLAWLSGHCFNRGDR